MNADHPAMSHPRVKAFFDDLAADAESDAWSSVPTFDLTQRLEAVIIGLGLASLATNPDYVVRPTPDLVTLELAYARLLDLTVAGDQMASFSVAHKAPCELARPQPGRCQDDWQAATSAWFTTVMGQDRIQPPSQPVPFSTLPDSVMPTWEEIKSKIVRDNRDHDAETAPITYTVPALHKLKSALARIPDMIAPGDDVGMTAPLHGWRDLIEYTDRLAHEHRVMTSVLIEAAAVMNLLVNPDPDETRDTGEQVQAIYDRAATLLPSLNHALIMTGHANATVE
jgi:hypothetical protein